MRTRSLVMGIAAVQLGMFACSIGRAADTPPPAEWPRVMVREGTTNTLYQPRLDSWDHFTWKGTSAIAIQPKDAPQPMYGTIEFEAKTRVDRAERTVYFEQLQITKTTFPSATPAQADTWTAKLRTLLPKEVPGISLDRVEAALAVLEAQKKGSGQPLKNEPPTILVSVKPAMLVPMDGKPVYRPVEKTKLERIINTRALILRDQSGKHYLHLYDGYVEASSLSGPWIISARVPSEVKTAEKAAVDGKQVDLLAGQENPDTKQKPSLKSASIPSVYVMGVPTELIVTTGDPQWAPISDTQLLYVTNTVSRVFKVLGDQKTYVLISGRWFRASSLTGPWEYVDPDNLPKDFASIPDEGTLENVKASVPGTRQAQEAVIANSIPNTVKVDRKKAQMDPPPKYDGAVQLKPIDGTSLQYVVNCSTPVIQVDSTSWYACQNGVWFVGANSSGPWAAATNVPAVIYSIPPSSPMYYVTFVRIYAFDANYVWCGTTPGYYGSMVSPDGVVVYGTGYSYPAYVGSTVYIAYPVTYGYGCNVCWSPWAGWTCGFCVGFACSWGWDYWCYCPPAPYWGPYYGWCYGSYYNAYGGITTWGPYGWAGTSGYIYHQNGPWTGVSRSAAGYNAWTGNQWAKQYGSAYNSTTGTSIVGTRGSVQNVYTGNYAYGGRAAGYNSQTGAAGVGGKVTVGNSYTGDSATVGRGTVYNPNTGNTTTISGGKGSEGNGYLKVNDKVIVGNDGNYYRPDGSGGWEQVTKPPPGEVNPQANTQRQQNTAATRQNTAATTPRQNATSGRSTYAPPAPMTTIQQPSYNNQQQWNRVQPTQYNQQQIQNLNNQYRAQQMGAQRQQSFQANRPAMRSGGGGRR